MKQDFAVPSKKQVLKSYVSEAEFEAITGSARVCCLSVSEFLKRIALGHEIKSRTDQQARLDLLKTNADLGRLGGLLKMWILDDDKHRIDVENLLEDIRQAQKEIVAKVRSI